ncbi:cytoskeletal protein RodZ [Streptomyces sp. SAI-135]|uniref:hypothetical protein n=1 Tax=unclassified Streptomyces TaxID=2593676 RepID=UPI0024731162|nr:MULTISPECIES: hypothetical protein [unclassified Streptomyces]MDH6521816.1 cytoskeletal protein RodZ [Streptomyces sp. SAI-090]MDH6554105.1 cytoskeletal protein RodZ [Streptomyces sp. SAI-041]MDH6573182.1 cytoskeletal protein RodZ [Streptomyces sp. SAI-117]MDH6614083.1 cytoskeletal protein RodZ [Streptomyces sp. SAI-135]
MKSILTHTAAVALGLIIGAVIGSSSANDSDSSTTPPATVTATTTATETATETESAPPTKEAPAATPSAAKKALAGEIPGDGTYIVGEEVRSGTYRTDGPEDAALPNCYWARLSGTSGELNEIIANANTTGPTTVTISASDKAFQTTGCMTWKRTG